jgi:hypothetical protein
MREETWKDFQECLEKVRFPAGYLIRKAFERSEGEGIERLLSMCKVLAEREPEEPFFIAERSAAPFFGVNRATIGRWLKQLEAEGHIRMVVSHSYGKRRAKGWLMG